MKKLILIFLIVGAWASAQGQQDAHFSQYVFNGLYINPAYAGYKQQLYLQHFYSSQWAGVTGAPRSLSLALDGNYRDNKVGLAVLMTHDEVGAQANSAGYLNYAYRLRIGNSASSSLAFGLGVGMVQSSLEGGKLEPTEIGDQFIPQVIQRLLAPDMRAGVYYSNDLFFAGFSADNLLPQVLPRRQPALLLPVPKPHFYLTAGTIFPITEDLKFKPTFLIKDDHAGPTSLDLNGFLLMKERLWLGGLYRTGINLYEKKNLEKKLNRSSSVGVIMEIFATADVRFGYAFEYSTNQLRNQNAGSHEISLGITFGPRRNQAVKCYF